MLCYRYECIFFGGACNSKVVYDARLSLKVLGDDGLVYSTIDDYHFKQAWHFYSFWGGSIWITWHEPLMELVLAYWYMVLMRLYICFLIIIRICWSFKESCLESAHNKIWNSLKRWPMLWKMKIEMRNLYTKLLHYGKSFQILKICIA